MEFYAYAATPNRLATNSDSSIASLLTNLFSCLFLNMCAASVPSIVRLAVCNERKQ